MSKSLMDRGEERRKSRNKKKACIEVLRHSEEAEHDGQVGHEVDEGLSTVARMEIMVCFEMVCGFGNMHAWTDSFDRGGLWGFRIAFRVPVLYGTWLKVENLKDVLGFRFGKGEGNRLEARNHQTDCDESV